MSTDGSLKRRDWALLAIASAGSHPLTPVQLQKILFVLGQEMRGPLGLTYYRFRPYNYGPFSAEVYTDAEELGSLNLVRLDGGGPNRSWSTFTATPLGLARAEELRKQAPPEAVKYLDAVVAWARRLSFQQLVSAIYERYPDQKVNSVFLEPAIR